VTGGVPDNLFTLLGDSYDLHVREQLTALCPPGLCDNGARGRGDLAGLLGDAESLWWDGTADQPASMEMNMPGVTDVDRYGELEDWIDQQELSSGDGDGDGDGNDGDGLDDDGDGLDDDGLATARIGEDAPAGDAIHLVEPPTRLDDIDVDDRLPLEVVGETALPVGTVVAYALNGTIGAVTTVEPAFQGIDTFAHGLLPPDLFVDGDNELTAYVVEGTPAAPVLHPLGVS
jgi:hypothetical protein